MITRIFIAAGLASGLMVSAANAVTITNLDKAPQNLSFTPKGGHVHHFTIAARHNRNIDCTGGGQLSLGKSTQICDAKSDRISIKGGKLEM